ncbi:MAG: type II secretion system protein GspE [Elusimicrobia bacterium CG_4_9_14_3_um_filter_62_55]|nr:MAG: type II secretion system protein GspE [Elusimicrobia bacterium CG22_combo_CG10-13_8_21_14_all_63_91]PJA16307.1 MAG: type II secretion system protein GspE [Elusimicrobia bacterium CG_4_10_14_0_2_um_filter_63_34]PJB26925.1 MAG: type II secretion system protein GspE [Elusimicrobia bacterium CG_4_9_14_3_um_filter_62_55]
MGLFSKRKDLETVLVEARLLSELQKKQAESMAAQERIHFGDAVVRLGYLKEAEIAKALSEGLGLPLADRASKMLEIDLESDLSKRVPEEFARSHHALPLFESNGVLTVALADPTDMLVRENLQVVSGRQIHPVVATKTDILKTIDLLYQRGGDGLIARTMESSSVEGDGGQENLVEVRLDLDAAVRQTQGNYAVNLVNAILKQAITERCSDIHLETCDREVMLRFRIDGTLHGRVPPPFQSFDAVVSRVKILSKLDIAERRLPQDGSFSLKMQNRVIDVRVSVCPAAYGEKVVMRLLDKDAVPLDIESLGFEAVQKEDFVSAAHQPNGLILLTGPTGSGKTTTLYSMLNRIKTTGKNFMSIEDPIEIKLKGMTQVAVKSAIGLTFASALRSFLRQDPDVILVGEIRDLETAQTCLRAALTGHLVLSTLHTNDAVSAVVRLIDLGAEPHLVASSLGLLAAQRLVRVLCSECREAYAPKPETLERACREAGLKLPADPTKTVFYRPRGCERCSNTGYIGRIGISEVFPIDENMGDIITTQGGDLAKLRAAVRAAGRLDLRAAGWLKVFRGTTSVEELLSVTVRR